MSLHIKNSSNHIVNISSAGIWMITIDRIRFLLPNANNEAGNPDNQAIKNGKKEHLSLAIIRFSNNHEIKKYLANGFVMNRKYITSLNSDSIVIYLVIN